MQRQLRRIKTECMPKSPQTPHEFIEIFANNDHLTNFGMCESNVDQKFYTCTVTEGDAITYTLFFSPPIAELVKTVAADERHYMMDATFSVVPSCGYKQLLIIHFIHDNHVSNTKRIHQ